MADQDSNDPKPLNPGLARFAKGAALLGLTAGLAGCPVNSLYGAPIDDDDSANASDDDDAVDDDDSAR